MPMRTCDCSADGMSTIVTWLAVSCGATGTAVLATGADIGHFPNASSSSGRTPVAVTSPATISVAFDGRYRAA